MGNCCQAKVMLWELLQGHIMHNISDIHAVEFDSFGNFSALQDLQGARTQFRLYSDHTFYETFQVARIDARWFLKNAFHYTLIQVIHVGSAEGWVKREGLIEHAS